LVGGLDGNSGREDSGWVDTSGIDAFYSLLKRLVEMSYTEEDIIDR
jgi:hypothetical protein